MGLFDIFGKKTEQKKTRTLSDEELRKEAQRIVDSFDGGKLSKLLAESDAAIKECREADEQYKSDGDIEKVISVYEKYFTEKPEWGSFNFNLRLAKYYVKAGRNDTAWSYLNKMLYWAMQPDSVNMDISKIRFEMFKILRSEKKYKDAMVTLILSYVENNINANKPYFNKKKFISDGKSTAKKLGIDEDEWVHIANDVERNIFNGKLKPQTVKQFCLQRIFAE